MKCEIERRIKENESEKIKYIKSELEKKGWKVKITKVNLEEEKEEEETEEEEEETEEEEEKEEREEVKKEWKMSEYLREKVFDGRKKESPKQVKEWRVLEGFTDLKKSLEYPTESSKKIKNPKEIANPYENFKKYLDKEIFRKEKSKAMERLNGGMKKIEGGMIEKEITIRIEVET
jgi:hypothetical protein